MADRHRIKLPVVGRHPTGSAQPAVTPDDLRNLVLATAPAGSGVLSFNTRTGAVSLLSADIVAALGYTPSAGGGSGSITASGYTTASGTILYRKTASSGAIEEQTLAILKADLGLTGTNSGDQTITLTGDVTGTGTGSFATTIGAGRVTLAMQANMATASVVYRKSAGAGAPEVQTLATLKTDLGLTGTNSGDQTITLTGDVTGSGIGSFVTTIGANKVTRSMLAATSGATLLGATTAGNVADLTAAQAKTFLAIAESDVANLTTDLAAKAPLANPQFTGVPFYQQPSPTAVNASATLTIAQLLTLIITTTSTTAVSLTLPTGTLTDAGILSGALAANEAFEWDLINLGSSSGAVTLVAGTAHTIVGSAVVAIGTSARFLTRKTATNTFITYRIA